MERIMIEARARKSSVSGNWYGQIRIFENGKFLWAQSSDIDRLNKDDALEDAENMRKDYE
jgi:hypothetical protein